MGRTDEGVKRPVSRCSRLLVVRCPARGAVFRHTVWKRFKLGLQM